MVDAAVADLTKLVANLRYAHQNIKAVSEAILDETSDAVLALMQEHAPVRHGRLRASLRVVKTPGKRVIGPQGVPYGKFQEFGTGIRGEFPTSMYVIRPKTPGGKLHFQVNGKHVTASEVHHPGIPPNPFVRPSAKQGLEGLSQKYGTRASALIVQGKQ